jgi:hypothetical protein
LVFGRIIAELGGDLNDRAVVFLDEQGSFLGDRVADLREPCDELGFFFERRIQIVNDRLNRGDLKFGLLRTIVRNVFQVCKSSILINPKR